MIRLAAHRPGDRNPRAFGLAGALALALCIAALGCPGVLPPPDGTGDDGGSTLEIRLFVSNPTPGVGEQVVLSCTVIAGDATGASFSFEPAGALLSVDARQGTASWIVDQTDVDVATSFACGAVAADGSTARSPAVLVIPTP